ncbi:MAG: HK97 family phage prohead protease [Verrucomicrobiota bacterium]
MTTQTIKRFASAPAVLSTIGDRQVEAIISDSSLARDGGTIVTAGIDYSTFLATKAILFNHETDKPVARVAKVWIDGDKLKMLAQFPPDGTSQQSDECYRLIKAGIINATSIGFTITKGVTLADRKWRADAIDLQEVSFVSVPALPTALITQRSAKQPRRNRSDRQRLVAELQRQIAEDGGPSTPMPTRKSFPDTRDGRRSLAEAIRVWVDNAGSRYPT